MKSNAEPQPAGLNRLLAGVDIGGTKTAVVLCAEPPQALWRAEFATVPGQGPDHALAQIVKTIRRGLAETEGKLQCIGVSCGGPLDRVLGVIQRPPNLPTWDDVPIKSFLESKFHVPCFLENDANAGAVAEHCFGAGRGCQHMIFLTLGTGLGAGLILNGKIFRGASSMAGEIGHVRLTPDGPEGYGKAGSVEGWASGGGMARHGARTVQQALAAGESTLLAHLAADLTARDIGEALSKGDSVARRIVDEAGSRLGEAVAILVDVLNPERIIVGGLALRFGERLLGPARERMHAEALPAAAAACSLVPAELGERIGDVAAICIAMGFHNAR